MSNEANLTARRMADVLDQAYPERIKAIKELRAFPGIDFGLKEAKDVVDARPGEYYRDVAYFETIITNRLAELTPMLIIKVETITTVTIHIPGLVSFNASAVEARTLRDQLNALDLG